MNIALILAGGKGTRIGADVPKQFIEVAGKPIIIHTLEKFQNCSRIDGIVVACICGEWQTELRNDCNKYNISKLIGICDAGETGLLSARNGINYLSKYENDTIILIHDAVRPFVDEESIISNIAIAEKYGTAMCSVESVETLVHTTDGIKSDRIINRNGLRRILTPQTFQLSILRELIIKADIENSEEPSIFALYMKMGRNIYCSKGNEKNIKITYLEDVEYFEKLFS